MVYRSPVDRRMVRVRVLRRVALLLVAGVILLWLDRPLHGLLSVASEDKARLESQDWYQMFRAAGYLPTWLLIAGTMILVEIRARGRAPVGWGVLAGALLSGLAAEGLKIVLGRHRPDEAGAMEWNPFLGAVWNPDLYGSSLGLPSSHTAVAFGAALVLCRLHPGAGWLAVLAAGGCALTRVLSGAHAVTDVYVAIVVAWAIAWVICRTGPRRAMMGTSRVRYG
jgi:membrane-associated phospholipid phosphatase